MKVVLIVLGFVGVLAHWICPATANAQSQLDDYDALLERAMSEYDNHHYGEARDLFARVHELDPDANSLALLGSCDFHLQRYAQSVYELQAALVESRNALNDAQREQVKGELGSARSRAARLTLETTPDQVELRLDERLVTGREFWLDEGDHSVDAHAEGYRAKRLELHLFGGEERHEPVRLEVERLEAPVATNPLRVQLAASKGSEPRRNDSRPGVWATWWFWTAAGAVVAGGIVTATVIANASSKPDYAAHDIGPLFVP